MHLACGALAEHEPRVMSARSKLFASVLAFGAFLTLAGCDSGEYSFTPPADAPLYGSAVQSDYSLIDSAGNPVSSADFIGQFQMIYFGYAYCPNVCPFDVSRMVQGYEQFAEANPDLAEIVQPIFITVDPERDTPEVVGEFTANFSDELIGLTGSVDQVEAAADAFYFEFYKIDPVVEGNDYDLQHASIGYLIDPNGQPMALLPVDQSGDAVAAELERWVR